MSTNWPGRNRSYTRRGTSTTEDYSRFWERDQKKIVTLSRAFYYIIHIMNLSRIPAKEFVRFACLSLEYSSVVTRCSARRVC
jgi:hypothetical protein